MQLFSRSEGISAVTLPHFVALCTKAFIDQISRISAAVALQRLRESLACVSCAFSVQHWDAKKKKFIQVQSSELRNKVCTMSIPCSCRHENFKSYSIFDYISYHRVPMQDFSANRRSESGGKVSYRTAASFISLTLFIRSAKRVLLGFIKSGS
jgi:hypothetical protein